MKIELCYYCKENHIDSDDVWICDPCWDNKLHLSISDIRRWCK